MANTTNRGGFSVEYAMDTRANPKGFKATGDELASLSRLRDDWHGEWNYLVLPLPYLGVVPAGA